MTPTNQEAYFEGEMEIRISAASLNHIGATDWTGYDRTASDAILSQPGPNMLSAAYNAIPQNFRLDVEVDAGFHIHA